MSADNYVVIRKFREGYKWGDFGASDDPQPHPDDRFRSAAFPSWQEAMGDAYGQLCIIEYGYSVEDPKECPACGTVGQIDVTSSRRILAHHPGCEYADEVFTCRVCGESMASDTTDVVIEQAVWWWKNQHPNLVEYMALLTEVGYTPTVEPIPSPRDRDTLLDEMDLVWDKLTDEEQTWVRDYMQWWNQKSR